jgi:hypothetical protein
MGKLVLALALAVQTHVTGSSAGEKSKYILHIFREGNWKETSLVKFRFELKNCVF